MTMLNLSEFEVVKQEQNEYYYRFTVECKEPPMVCTQCGWIGPSEFGCLPGDEGKEFERHAIKERIVADMPMHGKPVKLLILHRRYRCPVCDGTFYEFLDSVEPHDKVTRRLKAYIKTQSLHKPFLTLGNELDVSHTTVARYFGEYVAELDKEHHIVAPRVLGIDEAHLNKTMRGVFTDTENRMLLEITPDNLKRTVKATIERMEGYKNIEVVTADMYSGYKYAAQELIPGVTVVVDKFHVIQYTIRALDAIRIQLKKSLPKTEQRLLTYDRWVLLKNKEDLKPAEVQKRDQWFKHFPVLERAYWLKEEMRDIYKSPDRYEAFQRYYKWETSIPDEYKEFKEIRRTFNQHKQEIFNYFLKPFTNAYTESVNNIIKSVEKAGKGYKFEVLRAKVLYGTQATVRPKFDKDMSFNTFEHIMSSQQDDVIPIAEFDFTDAENPVFASCGVDLTTLQDIFERGEF